MNPLFRILRLTIRIVLGTMFTLVACMKQQEAVTQSDAGNLEQNQVKPNDEILISEKKIDGCPGGLLRVITVPGKKLGSTLKLSVSASAPLKIKEKMQESNPFNSKTLALVNGGYFDEKSGAVYSFFRGPLENNQSPGQSAIAGRTCGLYVPAGALPRVRYETEGSTEYKRLLEFPSTEVFCAGPKLVSEGKNVVSVAMCDEKFSASCRSDKTDPLDSEKNLPRAASCVTKSGDFRVFIQSSQTLSFPNGQCGTSLEQLAQTMLAHGCLNGMNHDGGSSVALFARTHLNSAGTFLTGPKIFNRAVPVYLRVFEDR